MRWIVISLMLSFFFSISNDVQAKPKARAASKSKRIKAPSVSKDKISKEDRTAVGAPSGTPGGTPNEEISVRTRGPTRIDFDDRLIQGQTNKSGAVYLFDRKELAVRSMVRQRTSFRDQIVKDVLKE